MRLALYPLGPIALAAALACGGAPEGEPRPAAGEPAGAAAPAAAAAAERPPRLVFLGDSLTAGLGLGEESAFPALVAEALAREGAAVEVVNAGVSGDTSAGGLARLDWILRQRPDVVFVALGANDGLRGIPPEATAENLRRIVERARAAGARVLLAGMKLPPNYGPDYGARFEAIFPRLAGELEVPLVPFLLDGVGGRPELNLADGIHPNAAGHERIAETVLPLVREALPTG